MKRFSFYNSTVLLSDCTNEGKRRFACVPCIARVVARVDCGLRDRSLLLRARDDTRSAASLPAALRVLRRRSVALRALRGFPRTSAFPYILRLWLFGLRPRLLDGLTGRLLDVRIVIAVAQQRQHRRVSGSLQRLVQLPIVARVARIAATRSRLRRGLLRRTLASRRVILKTKQLKQ